MSDTREKTMQQEAQEERNDLRAEVETIRRLYKLDGRADQAAEELEDDLRSRPLCAETEITVNVTLGTGGPARGVEFDCERTSYGLDWHKARCWHQDWYTSKGYAELDKDTAQYLWDLWGLEMTET